MKYGWRLFLALTLFLSHLPHAHAQQTIGSACPTIGWTTIQPNQIVYCNTSNVWSLGVEISSTGSVGIGTTAPTATLDTHGNIVATSASNDGTYVGIYGAGGSVALQEVYAGAGYPRWAIGRDAISGGQAGITFWGGGSSIATNGTAIGAGGGGGVPTSSTLSFYTSNGTALTERMRINGSGQIGIATTSPVVSFDLSQKTDALALPVGTIAQRPSAPVNGMLRYNTSNFPSVEAYVNSAWASLSGGSGAGSITLGTSATATNPQRSGDSTTGLFSPAASTLSIAASGMEIMRVNSSGLGVGTTSPHAPLHVNGEAIVGTTGLSCSSTTAGALQYASGSLQFCNGTAWQTVNSAGSGGTTPGCGTSATLSTQTQTTLNVAAGCNVTLKAWGGAGGGTTSSGSVSGGGSGYSTITISAGSSAVTYYLSVGGGGTSNSNGYTGGAGATNFTGGSSGPVYGGGGGAATGVWTGGYGSSGTPVVVAGGGGGASYGNGGVSTAPGCTGGSSASSTAGGSQSGNYVGGGGGGGIRRVALPQVPKKPTMVSVAAVIQLQGEAQAEGLVPPQVERAIQTILAERVQAVPATVIRGPFTIRCFDCFFWLMVGSLSRVTRR